MAWSAGMLISYPSTIKKSTAFMKSIIFRILCLLCLGFVSVTLVGCATREDDELSQRPWNSPKRWENGLPSAITEGR